MISQLHLIIGCCFVISVAGANAQPAVDSVLSLQTLCFNSISIPQCLVPKFHTRFLESNQIRGGILTSHVAELSKGCDLSSDA
jgi:hypothetical protein